MNNDQKQIKKFLHIPLFTSDITVDDTYGSFHPTFEKLIPSELINWDKIYSLSTPEELNTKLYFYLKGGDYQSVFCLQLRYNQMMTQINVICKFDNNKDYQSVEEIKRLESDLLLLSEFLRKKSHEQ